MKPATLTAASIRTLLPKRSSDSHKGRNGHVLIIAGSRGMSGAAVLSGSGALRAGAGLVTVATPENERVVVAQALPEVLTLPLPESSEGCLDETAWQVIQSYLKKRKVTTLAVGPGLSVSPSIHQLIKTLIHEVALPLVLDADGLNVLSADDFKHHGELIITPHPMELARLLHQDAATIQKDRAGTAERTARELDVVCVLKGHHSLISNGRITRQNPTGNPAMATGGMGDVLTGAIAALWAQGLTAFDAACAGVYLHGLAADLAHVSDRGLLATDVANALPHALAKIGVK